MTLTDAYVEGMDRLVEMGIYLDHQDAIRDVLRSLLKEHRISPFYPEPPVPEDEG